MPPSGHARAALTAAAIAAVLAFAPPVHAADIPAAGAFTCDFGLAAGLPPDQLAPAIERDRMYQSARPGFQRKLIPIRSDLGVGLQSGGRYLFDTAVDAHRYRDWLTTDYALDGTLFLQRPYFLAPDCHAWETVGAADFAPPDQHVVMRTERFATPVASQQALLTLLWPVVSATAKLRGLAGVWLLYDRVERLASLVYFAGPGSAPAPVPLEPPVLESEPPLGSLLPYPRVFDRTSWVLTRWAPFAAGDHGAPSQWPSSPPLPQPSAADGLCEPSRGETAATAAGDCMPSCGNAVADPLETTLNCPSDVRPFKKDL